MADTNNQNNSINNQSDILSALLGTNNTELNKQNQLLGSIDITLRKILQNGGNMSMSNLNNMRGQDTRSTTFTQRYNDSTSSSNNVSFGRNSTKGAFDSFTNALERELLNGLLGADLNGLMKSALNQLADDIGVNIKDIPKMFGSELGKKLLNTDLGGKIAKSLQGKAGTFISNIKNKYQQGVNDYYARNQDAQRPVRNQSQSTLRDSIFGNRESGTDGSRVANSSGSGISSNDIVIHASNVIVYLDGEKIFSNGGIPGDGDSVPNSDIDSKLRQILTDSLGEDTVANVINDAGLNELTGILRGGAEAGEVESKLLSLLGDSGITDLAGLSQSLISTFERRNTDNSNLDNDRFSMLRQILTDSLGENIAGDIQDAGLSELTGLLQGGAGTGEVESQLLSLLGDSGAGFDLAGLSQSLVSTLGIGEAGAGVSAALSGLTAAIAPLASAILPVVIGFIALKAISNALAPAMGGFKTAIEGAKKAANRYSASQKANIDNAQKRLLDDVETMVRTPFAILEDAAKKWYDTWDENLRKINGTQGYNKEELQSLMGAFADRLREENLTSAVSAADITDNLAKVLDSGLSGVVAEEFAYLATKLNAAVPTQDFFGYADTYASIAANSIRMGKSQEQAIADANSQLEAFASNVLYASREVAGGFTTGLKDAESLFKQSVQIAQAGKTNNATEISAVMTAVSAITGAIAPDLATSMTDAIYKAATGGNSSEIVALRSLAGINASNTEFIKQLASNPKEIFADLFTELAKRQSMSESAYMEVAEGLSNIFGISMDAFARVDFAYLAQAISEMNSSNSSLDKNIALLASGETTTTAEQLKMQQINKVILDEGLAYVLDNEAAREIQKHMWEEQIARELMEARYGVELQGDALEFLEGIRQTVDNILGFLNPFKILGKLANLGASIAEASALKADVAGLLEAGKVGNGKAESKYQLTTRNRDLNLTDSIVNMMGGTSLYDGVSGLRKAYNAIANPFTYGGRLIDDIGSYISAGINTVGFNKFTGESSYNWNTIGKSIAKQIAATPQKIPSGTSIASASASQLSMFNNSTESNTEKAQNQANDKVKTALDSMSDFVQNDTEHTMTYEDWKEHTANKYFKGDIFKSSIKKFDEALEGAGMSEESVKGQFDMLQTQVAGKEKLEREKREEQFWENNTKLLTTTTDWLESINTHTENLFKKFEDYYSEWTKYFIDHKVYNSAFTHEDYDRISRQEKEGSETAIYALADALTQNKVDLLLDPTLQTNALLAQILKVAAAILNQTKDSGTALSLPDTIAGLSLGIVNV